MSAKFRVYSVKFKERVARRMLNGETIKTLCKELDISSSVLYRWRETYRLEGVEGLRVTGRPLGSKTRMPGSPEEAAKQRIGELERKIGQQVVDIDFLRRAFKRVKESRQKNAATGGTASTERSEA